MFLIFRKGPSTSPYFSIRLFTTTGSANLKKLMQRVIGLPVQRRGIFYSAAIGEHGAGAGRYPTRDQNLHPGYSVEEEYQECTSINNIRRTLVTGRLPVSNGSLRDYETLLVPDFPLTGNGTSRTRSSNTYDSGLRFARNKNKLLVLLD